MKREVYKGYVIELDEGLDGWAYSVAFGMKNLGRFLGGTYDDAVAEAKALIDDDISQRASPDNAQIGELRIALNAMYRRLVDVEKRIRRLEAEPVPMMAGSIEGLEGEWTVTPPPEFEA